MPRMFIFIDVKKGKIQDGLTNYWGFFLIDLCGFV